MTTSPTQARSHPLQKFLWPAVAVLGIGMFVISFIAGAVYGKGVGEDHASAAWYNATRNCVHVMRDLDVSKKQEPLSELIHKLDQRLLLESPLEASDAVAEVTKEFNK